MANRAHISVLLEGVPARNSWRKQNPDIRPDLEEFDFTEIKPVHWTDSSGTRHATQLWRIDLNQSNLKGARISSQEFFEASLSCADLEGAILNDAILKFSDLSKANLRRANLKGARLIGVNLQSSDLSGAAVFGISPWRADLKNAIQKDLVLTRM